MTFLSTIGKEALWLGAAILGGLALFLGFRSHYVNKGERRARQQANSHAVRKMIISNKAEKDFQGEIIEPVDISDICSSDDCVWSNESVTGR